jgi:hypothetical protein
MNNFVGAMAALFFSVTTAVQPTVVIPTPTPTPEVEEEPPSPEQVALADFLAAKKSPMPADVLIKYSNWQSILAISNAESSYCTHPAGRFNCYGIKDFRRGGRNFGGYRNFTSWEESIGYASELLYKYDTADGNPSPHVMVVRWTGFNPPSQGWVRNVAGSLRDIQTNVTAKTVSVASAG